MNTVTSQSENLVQQPVPDLEAVKAKQQAAWSDGNYATVGVTLQLVGESLCEAVNVCGGERLLDVAAGNGNATLAAARRFAFVTSTDYVSHLLRGGQKRAEAEGLHVDFEIADAENLPYDDDSFDVVVSTFGVMFTPNHQRAADQMLRVLRSGGRLGLANWSPEGFIGRLFKTIGRFVPPPAGVQPPSLWGTESHLQALFGSEAASIQIERKHFNFRYRSAEHWIDVFRNYYGPVKRAFDALDPSNQRALHDALHALLSEHNHGGDTSLIVPSEYLEVVIVKR